MDYKNPFSEPVTPSQVQQFTDSLPPRGARPYSPPGARPYSPPGARPYSPPGARPYPPEATPAPQAPQATQVPGRPGYYVPPGASPYSPAPSTMQRFARSLAATPNLTEDAMAHYALKYSPDQYNEMRARRASGGHTLPQPPATTRDHRNTEYMASLIKQVSDPLGLAASWYGRPLQMAGGGALYEGAKEAMNQRASGAPPNSAAVLRNSVAGGVGTFMGALPFVKRPDIFRKGTDPAPPLAGVLGRQLASSTTGELVQDAEARVTGRY